MNPFKGRTQIFSESPITSENVKSVLEKAVQVHNANATQIQFLYDYYRGSHPVLNRVKKYNADICNKIVENHAYEIVQFKLSYEFAYPVKYVSRGEPDKSAEIANVERFLRESNKYTCDGEIAQWLYICGVGYRFSLPNNAYNADYRPIKVRSYDPRNAFVIYRDDGGFNIPAAGVIIRTDSNGKRLYNVYTENEFIVCGDDFKPKTVDSHYLGMIPLIEYRLNPDRMGAFEPIIGILDGIDTLDSNRIDAVESVVQSLTIFLNADIDEATFKMAKEQGAICIKSQAGAPADAKALQFNLSQDEVQTAISHLYDMALTIVGMPDRQSRTGGGDTGAAVSLRNGWSIAEARALLTERFWNESDREFLRLVIRICDNVIPASVKDLRPSDVDIKFTRNLSDNLLVKTQALQNLVKCGMNIESALQVVGLVSDPHAVALASPAMQASVDMILAELDAVKKSNAEPVKTEENAELVVGVS